MKKYELIKESKDYFAEREIFRIRALKDFSDIKVGDIGGWVCSEDNLSQEGNCWIYDNAKCLDDARILDNAKMYDNTMMIGNSRMYDNAKMSDSSIICDNAVMCGNARMYDTSTMCGSSMMRGNATMFNNSKMYDSAKMCGNSTMYDNSVMYDNAEMYDGAEMLGRAILDEDKILYGSINKSYKNIFQHLCKKRFLIAILTKENEILYSVGCQIGITKERLINIIYNDCEAIGEDLKEYSYRQEYLDIIDMAENYLRKFI